MRTLNKAEGIPAMNQLKGGKIGKFIFLHVRGAEEWVELSHWELVVAEEWVELSHWELVRLAREVRQ